MAGSSVYVLSARGASDESARWLALMHKHGLLCAVFPDLAAQEGEGAPVKPGLFLCGQFNNGQIRLPGLGPVYIPRQADGSGGFFPGDEGFSGLSITQGIPVYVSPGLGVSGYYPVRLRLFNRPALTLIELTRAMTR